MPGHVADSLGVIPLVSVIITNYNGAHLLEPCLRSLMALDYPPSRREVLVIDNGSTDDSAELVHRQFPKVRWIAHAVNNYTRALNIGLSLSVGEFMVCLNNDTIVEPRWLTELVSVTQQDPRVGACGSKIVLMDGRLNSTGHRSLPGFYWVDRGCEEPDRGQYERLEEMESLTGCALLIRRQALEQVGLFDEDFNLYVEDVDLCIRLRQEGWKLLYVPTSVVRHMLHGTSTERDAEEWVERNRLLLVAKHYPEQLGKALCGRGYWTYPKQPQPGALLRLMPTMLEKLTKHHGSQKAARVLPSLFGELDRVQRYELDQFLRDCVTQHAELQPQLDDPIKLGQAKAQEYERAIAAYDVERDGHQRQLASSQTQLTRAAREAMRQEFPTAHTPMTQNGQSASPMAGCTIIAKNYLSYARVLCRSFLTHHPGMRFFVLLVDECEGYFDPAREPFELIRLDTLGISELQRLRFQYDVTELSTAVKPSFLAYLMERCGIDNVIFLDPDILVLRPLTHVIELLSRHSFVLTPHLTSLLPLDGKRPSELTILNAGTFNLGFIALRRSDTVRRMLEWWRERLKTGCEMAPNRGMHVDQKWVDLVPGLFGEVAILRDPGYNVAYWNMGQWPMSVSGDEVFVAGTPCVFIHFSGLDPDRLHEVSKHQNRFSLDQLGDAGRLFAHYRDLLMAHGYRESRGWPYTFATFDTGAHIPDVVKKLYRGLGERVRAFGDPFATAGQSSFFQWLNESIDEQTAPEQKITRLWQHIYMMRSDVQSAYPDILGVHRAQFLDWITNFGQMEHRIDCHLTPKGKRATGATAHSDPVGVNLAGYVQSEKGTGESVRAALRALQAARVPHVVNDLEELRTAHAYLPSLFRDNLYGVNLLHVNANEWPVVAQRLGNRYFDGRYNIGYWAWELSEFPSRWRTVTEHFDEIWVPSQFVLEAVSRVVHVPVIRMPHAVSMETDLNGREASRSNGRGHATVQFLCVFDFMSYWQRKNPFGVLEAFKRAFPSQDGVQLTLKAMHGSFAPHIVRELKQAAQGAAVRIIDAIWSRDDVVRLIAGADCLVSLHRSEGFGLVLAEAMALGKPVIATGYSGNLDFMTPQNSLLVDYQLVELRESVGPYMKGSRWAEPALDHAAELMRWVVECAAEAQEIGRCAAKTARESLSPSAIGMLVRERLRVIQDTMRVRPSAACERGAQPCEQLKP